jgi:hypothetical protein
VNSLCLLERSDSVPGLVTPSVTFDLYLLNVVPFVLKYDANKEIKINF